MGMRMYFYDAQATCPRRFFLRRNHGFSISFGCDVDTHSSSYSRDASGEGV